MSERELFMPFVNVKSKGGIFDDDAFVAGYEMGLFDARCQQSKRLGIKSLEVMMRTDNVAQADLIAMAQGYSVKTINESDGWSEVWVGLTETKETDK